MAGRQDTTLSLPLGRPHDKLGVMPLLDHFHPPVSQRRSWEGFHGLWAAALVEKLNRDILGDEFFADMQVHIGSQVEVDVATLDEHATKTQSAVATATLAPVWSPPATNLIVPTVFPDEVEVQVFATATGATLEPPATTYAVAYRPSRQPSGDQIEVWPTPLSLGGAFPTLPLALRNAAVVPIDLEEAYTEACRRSRLAS